MDKKILLTGAGGYIGSHLLPELVKAGYLVTALVRNPHSFYVDPALKKHVTIIQGDLQDPESLRSIPEDIEIAYYLVHAMATSLSQFETLEKQQAEHFVEAMKRTKCKQIIYLGGLISSDQLSAHLSSRLTVETILKSSSIPCTVLRAGIIIGAGSASFEIIRDLVEKLPVMIAPKWVKSLCQPISIKDIIPLLMGVIDHPKCLDQVFDVGGTEQISYQEMLYGYANCRKLKRFIIPVPVLTPRLSSYWLYFVTTTNLSLAMALVDSLKSDAICQDLRLLKILNHTCLSYQESIKETFKVTNSAPKYGCLIDETRADFSIDRQEVIRRIWSIGGDNGWYSMNWAWKLRGWLDERIGGVGLRRGRVHPDRIDPSDHLDFWKVIVSDQEKGHLLLQAEMKVPGEAWLEFSIQNQTLVQKATFRSKGLLGRAYWYVLLPLHLIVFHRMAKALTK